MLKRKRIYRYDGSDLINVNTKIIGLQSSGSMTKNNTFFLHKPKLYIYDGTGGYENLYVSKWVDGSSSSVTFNPNNIQIVTGGTIKIDIGVITNDYISYDLTNYTKLKARVMTTSSTFNEYGIHIGVTDNYAPWPDIIWVGANMRTKVNFNQETVVEYDISHITGNHYCAVMCSYLSMYIYQIWLE